MFVLVKHPLADCDLEEAALAYARRAPGLAERFIDEAEATIRALAVAPLQHRIRFDDVRRVNLSHFPYGCFYIVEEGRVCVLGVLHAARDHERALARRRAVW